MKYKVGDSITIKSKEEIDVLKDKDHCISDTCWNDDMDYLCGKTYTVLEVVAEDYQINEDDPWYVNDAMIADTAMGDPASKYNKPITGLDGVKTTVDVYRVLVAFGITDPELQHSLKKLLNLGTRGKGNYTQDLDEAILSLQKMEERKEQECK